MGVRENVDAVYIDVLCAARGRELYRAWKAYLLSQCGRLWVNDRPHVNQNGLEITVRGPTPRIRPIRNRPR